MTKANKVETHVKAADAKNAGKTVRATPTDAQLRLMRLMAVGAKGGQGAGYTRAQLKAATHIKKGYSALLRGNENHPGLEKHYKMVLTHFEGRLCIHTLTKKGLDYVAENKARTIIVHTQGDANEKLVTFTPVAGKATSKPTKGKGSKATKGKAPAKVKATKAPKVEKVAEVLTA